MAYFYGQTSRYLTNRSFQAKRKAFSWLFLAVIVLTASSWFLVSSYGNYKNGQTLSWFVPVAVLVAVGVVSLLIAGIKYFLFKAGLFAQGKDGEEIVYADLLSLPDNFSVFRGLHLPSQNSDIDFVVIGPSGVFTIEVKSHKGRIIVTDHNIFRNDRLFPQAYILNQAANQARKMRQFLKIGKEVKSLLVFSSQQASVEIRGIIPGDVLVLHLDNLLNVILNSNRVLSVEQQKEILQKLIKLRRN